MLALARTQADDSAASARLMKRLHCTACKKEHNVRHAKDGAHPGTNVFGDPIMVNWPQLEKALWIGILRNLGSNPGFVISRRRIRHLQKTWRRGCPQNASGVRRS